MKYEIDKSMPQGANGHLDKAQEDWLRLMPDGWDGTPFVGVTDVLRAIDQLRRDLSGYHGQLKAHDDLQRHCDNQRKRIAELEGLYAKAKADKYTRVIGRVRIGELGGAALEVVSLSCGHMTIDEAGQAPAYCPTCGAKAVE